jgi:hypothetical protein
MPRTRLHVARTAQQELLSALNEVPDEQVSCRIKHRFPLDEYVIGKKLPSSVHARASHDGCYQIVDTCDRCGVERVMTTLPGGELDPGAVWRYAYPDDWVRFPQGMPRGKRVFLGEMMRRSQSQFRALVRAVAVAEEDTSGRAPQVLFKGAPS